MMANMKKHKTPVPKLSPQIRIKNFNEVELGYTHEMALEEASRCLNCKHKPCVSGCPVNIDIPCFIQKLLKDDINSAYSIISKYSALPAVCGRVCPQEKQCELKCVRGKNGEPVSIGKLERYVADNSTYSIKACRKIKNIKIAVIGSGPSGITCARELAILGYDVTIFEALHCPGGVLAYGIPEFRLPQKILNKEIHNLVELEVKILTNTVIGKTFTIGDLLSSGYKAIYICTGAGIPKFMNIPGEKLPGVYSANEFLTRINLMHAYSDEYDTPIIKPKHTVVVGGGNVSMDAARCARRLNSEVTVIYRRNEEDMPARKEEIENAKEENINFMFLTSPIKILGTDRVTHIECAKMSYKCANNFKDISQHNKNKILSETPNKRVKINADCVIIAIGNNPNSIIKNNTKGINFDDKGRIVVDNNSSRTSMPGIYAGGDAVTGAATVILAMEAGKKAANNIHNDLINSGDAYI